MFQVYEQQRMVEMKMREIDREIEQARLIREAEQAKGPNLIARIAAALKERAVAQAAPRLEKRSRGSKISWMLTKKTAG